MKEVQLKEFEEEKRRRVDIQPPKPSLSPSNVYSELYKCTPDAAVFSVLPGFSWCGPKSQNEYPPPLEGNLPISFDSLYDKKNRNLKGSELERLCEEVFEELRVTEEEASYLQQATIKQSQSLTWHKYRQGRITASHFHDVYKHMQSGRKYPISIIKRIMQYYSNVDNVNAMKWGRENEDRGCQQYISCMEGKHDNFRVKKSGLVVDPKYPFLGASPDGLVSCTCCGTGVVEIKCPFKYRHCMPTNCEQLSDTTYFLKRGTTGEIHLSPTHKYFYQVQGQIALCRAAYCDFICWTTKGLFIERVKKDETFIAQMLPELKQFFVRYLLPELLTHNLSHSTSSSAKENEILYCICHKPEHGHMIACDNPNCTVEWYHYECVGLKRAPRGNWCCPTCRKS